MNLVSTGEITKYVSVFSQTLEPRARYASWDYSYNYFYERRNGGLTDDMQRSSTMLGFYLASWGMLRGSSYLLNKSAKHYEKVIEYIESCDEHYWDIDIDNYDDSNIDILLEVYSKLKENIEVNEHTHLTLITKMMLGVFGFVPAFDNYFCESFRELQLGSRFRRFNKESLLTLREFYVENSAEVSALSKEFNTIDYETEKPTSLYYPKAKIIDMYGFQKGLSASRRKSQ